MFASANDISTTAIAILNSTLVRPVVTRRWFKPTAYTADILAGVGAPWGFRRISLSASNPHKTITALNKAGRFRSYTSLLTLIPDWDIGFTILAAGNITGSTGFDIADFLGETIFPAFDAAAKDEADKMYSGVYAARGAAANGSMLVVSTDPAKPGLGVGPWLSNGIDMAAVALAMQSGSPVVIKPAVRLYWTDLETVAADGSKRQAFKAMFEDEGYPARDKPKMFSTDCAAWLGQTGVTYASLPLDEFVFNLDPAGKVVSVDNLALRVTLYKQV